jgi:hypothetical protein
MKREKFNTIGIIRGKGIIISLLIIISVIGGKPPGLIM